MFRPLRIAMTHTILRDGTLGMIPYAVQFFGIPVLLRDLFCTLAVVLLREQSSLGVSDGCVLCFLRLVGLAIRPAAGRKWPDRAPR